MGRSSRDDVKSIDKNAQNGPRIVSELRMIYMDSLQHKKPAKWLIIAYIIQRKIKIVNVPTKTGQENTFPACYFFCRSLFNSTDPNFISIHHIFLASPSRSRFVINWPDSV